MKLVSISDSGKENALTVLRTETALSRFPLHLLTSNSDVQIELQHQNGTVYWSVSYNSKFGAPGQLAYKIDTLLVNRRIEETGRVIPESIRLGTLPEISEELGFHTRNWKAIRQALFQNASAFINAKITYRRTDGTEQWLEAGFTRYQVILTGESLPDGTRADAVYIVLNSVYREVLSNAVFRPLDYDYMKTLPPIAQRFYEIISYQIYAALKYQNPRARLLYSDYCLYSTAKRYFDFDHVKKQMYKVLRPHVQSGYVSKVEYQATFNERGEADWWMYYTPGVNASREYQAFTGQTPTRKSKPKQKKPNETITLPFEEDEVPPQGKIAFLPGFVQTPSASEPEKVPTPLASALEDDKQKLIAALIAADLNRSDALRFAVECPDVCRRQLAYLPFVEKFKTSRGAYLRRAIESEFGPPAGWQKSEDQKVEQQRASAKRAQELFQANQEKARKGHQERFREEYLNFLREIMEGAKNTHPGAFKAFAAWEEQERAIYFKPPFAGRPASETALEVFDREETHLERFVTFSRSRGAMVPTFWEWDEQISPDTFRP